MAGYVLRLLQLPLCMLGIWGIFGTGAIGMLTRAVEGKPLLEIAVFAALALVPYSLAKFRLMSTGLEVVVKQIARLLVKLRGNNSAAAHLTACAKRPLARVAQAMLYFVAFNLLVNALPDNLVMKWPSVLRFLDRDGSGIIEAGEIEDFAYAFTSRMLSAFLLTQVVTYIIQLKRPPSGWSAELAQRRAEEAGGMPLIHAYWCVAANGAGWWTLVDRISTGLLWLTMAYTWIVAIGIDPKTVATAGGAGGLALGLAAQQVVGNGVAALIILATAPCKVGDTVEVGGAESRFRGRVHQIGWSATALTQADGTIVYVPNSVLLQEPLVVCGDEEGEPPLETAPSQATPSPQSL